MHLDVGDYSVLLLFIYFFLGVGWEGGYKYRVRGIFLILYDIELLQKDVR